MPTEFPKAPASLLGLRCLLAQEERTLQAGGWGESWEPGGPRGPLAAMQAALASPASLSPPSFFFTEVYLQLRGRMRNSAKQRKDCPVCHTPPGSWLRESVVQLGLSNHQVNLRLLPTPSYACQASQLLSCGIDGTSPSDAHFLVAHWSKQP